MSNTLTEVRLPLPHSFVAVSNVITNRTCGAHIIAQIMVHACTSRDYDNIRTDKDLPG